MWGSNLAVTNDSPVCVFFTVLCCIALMIDAVSSQALSQRLMSLPASHMKLSEAYRLVLYIFAHSGWPHLCNNSALFLIVGTGLERRFGSVGLEKVIVLSAVGVGLMNFALSSTALVGASGVVFAFIFLRASLDATAGEVPVSFLLVGFFWSAKELMSTEANVSHAAHLAGGVVGAALGLRKDWRRAAGLAE